MLQLNPKFAQISHMFRHTPHHILRGWSDAAFVLKSPAYRQHTFKLDPLGKHLQLIGMNPDLIATLIQFLINNKD